MRLRRQLDAVIADLCNDLHRSVCALMPPKGAVGKLHSSKVSCHQRNLSSQILPLTRTPERAGISHRLQPSFVLLGMP
jgi:hypothetical protein